MNEPAPGTIVLGPNQYGKAECRLVRLTRGTPEHPDRHLVEDLTVTSQLRGDFEACHTEGDNSRVVATDTQKNTVHAFAREHGVHSPERFLLRLADHFVGEFDWVSGGRWYAEQHAWERIGTDHGPHDHAFVRSGAGTRTALVHRDDEQTHVLSGIRDCTVLKSTGSEFSGFPRDRYTTLTETDDRVLATSITAWWRCTGDLATTAGEHDRRWEEVRDVLLATFADLHSLALQQSIFAMGRAVLERFDDIAEIRLSCPNKHHFLVDLAPFGLDNPGEVFHAADRPYGLIEAAVQRHGAPQAPDVWAGVAGFC